jgi:hypothetical protein
VGGTDTRSSVLDWLAIKQLVVFINKINIPSRLNLLRDREFSEVVTNHLRLDFDLVEFLSRVDTDNRADHLWDNDHVTEVGLDEVWLLVGLGLLLRLAELLDQTHWLALETAVETTAGAGMDNITKLVG